jgi:hypothetical protein
MYIVIFIFLHSQLEDKRFCTELLWSEIGTKFKFIYLFMLSILIRNYCSLHMTKLMVATQG